jgi:hypothetical protein
MVRERRDQVVGTEADRQLTQTRKDSFQIILTNDSIAVLIDQRERLLELLHLRWLEQRKHARGFTTYSCF